MRARNKFQQALAILAAVCLLTSPLGAQNPQPPAVNPRQAPAPPLTPLPLGKGTIRSTVDLVEIDVQVTGKNSKPIKGLNQDQFTLTEDGKLQKISSFEYNDIEKIETAPTAGETPVTVPLGTVASPDAIKSQVRDHRLIVLFFDMSSLESEDLLRSTRAADKFLREQMTPADLVAAIGPSISAERCLSGGIRCS